ETDICEQAAERVHRRAVFDAIKLAAGNELEPLSPAPEHETGCLLDDRRLRHCRLAVEVRLQVGNDVPQLAVVRGVLVGTGDQRLAIANGRALLNGSRASRLHRAFRGDTGCGRLPYGFEHGVLRSGYRPAAASPGGHCADTCTRLPGMSIRISVLAY